MQLSLAREGVIFLTSDYTDGSPRTRNEILSAWKKGEGYYAPLHQDVFNSIKKLFAFNQAQELKPIEERDCVEQDLYDQIKSIHKKACEALVEQSPRAALAHAIAIDDSELTNLRLNRTVYPGPGLDEAEYRHLCYDMASRALPLYAENDPFNFCQDAAVYMQHRNFPQLRVALAFCDAIDMQMQRFDAKEDNARFLKLILTNYAEAVNQNKIGLETRGLVTGTLMKHGLSEKDLGVKHPFGESIQKETTQPTSDINISFRQAVLNLPVVRHIASAVSSICRNYTLDAR